MVWAYAEFRRFSGGLCIVMTCTSGYFEEEVIDKLSKVGEGFIILAGRTSRWWSLHGAIGEWLGQAQRGLSFNADGGCFTST